MERLAPTASRRTRRRNRLPGAHHDHLGEERMAAGRLHQQLQARGRGDPEPPGPRPREQRRLALPADHPVRLWPAALARHPMGDRRATGHRGGRHRADPAGRQARRRLQGVTARLPVRLQPGGHPRRLRPRPGRAGRAGLRRGRVRRRPRPGEPRPAGHDQRPGRDGAAERLRQRSRRRPAPRRRIRRWRDAPGPRLASRREARPAPRAVRRSADGPGAVRQELAHLADSRHAPDAPDLPRPRRRVRGHRHRAGLLPGHPADLRRHPAGPAPRGHPGDPGHPPDRRRVGLQRHGWSAASGRSTRESPRSARG